MFIDVLERIYALVRESCVPDRYCADAIQEVYLAELEGRDPKRAIERYVRRAKRCGLIGDVNQMPRVVRAASKLTTDETAETELLRREEDQRREEIGARAWLRLTRREQEIVRLRAMGWTQVEIAAHLGITQQRVSRLLTKIALKSNTYTQ